MAILRGSRKRWLVDNDRVKLFLDADSPHIMEPVRKGTHPRHGFDHPAFAIGDQVELVTARRYLRLFDGRVYKILGISLSRLPDARKIKDFDWYWRIDVERH